MGQLTYEGIFLFQLVAFKEKKGKCYHLPKHLQLRISNVLPLDKHTKNARNRFSSQDCIEFHTIPLKKQHL